MKNYITSKNFRQSGAFFGERGAVMVSATAGAAGDGSG